jgi:hypothetical protein
MATMGTGAPPTAPQVARQQRGVSQYGGAALAQGAPGAPDPTGGGGAAQSSTEFIKSRLAQVAQLMSQIAKVLSSTRPELMPVMQKMAGMGQTIEQEVTKSPDQGGSPSVPQDAPQQGTAPPSDDEANVGV